MKFEQTSFNDYPFKIVRDFLRHLRDRARIAWVEEYCAEQNIRGKFIAALIEHGLVTRDDRGLKITKLGIRVRATSMIPRMNRVAINQLVTNVQKRVSEVNSDDRFGMEFAMLGLFGSVLNEQAKDFGDLDVFYRLEYKPFWEKRKREAPDEWEDELCEHHLEHFPQDEHVSSMWLVDCVDTRALKHAKGRQGRISLHSEYMIQTLEANQIVPQRLLFGVRSPKED